MKIIDLHCDTIMECLFKDNHPLRSNDGHISLEKMKAGQALAQCFALYIPSKAGEGIDIKGTKVSPYGYYMASRDLFYKEIAANSDLIAPALTAADVIANKEAGKMSAILTVEDCVAVDGKIERVEEMFNDGVRMASITWNYENSLAFPNSRDEEQMKLGLKPFGIEALAKMDELGIIADVSHLSEGGFWDIVKYGKKPFVASHSCARALCDHPRNLTDEQLKALGEKGGAVGVNFCSAFILPGAKFTSIEDTVRHLVYMGNKAGVDALAMGSDFDGIGNGLEIKDYSGFPALVDGLKGHFTSAEIDKICYGNALRVFKDVVGK